MTTLVTADELDARLVDGDRLLLIEANNTGLLWWGGNNADSASGNRYFMFGVKEDGAGPAGEAAFAAPRLLIDYTVPEPGATMLLAAASLTLIARRRKGSLLIRFTLVSSSEG